MTRDTFAVCISQSPQARAERAKEKKKKRTIARVIRAAALLVGCAVCYIVFALAYALIEAFIVTADAQIMGLAMMLVIAVAAILVMIKW